MVDALSYDALKLFKDLMMAPPAVNPYSTLNDRILLAMQLTVVQMAMKLMAASDIEDRRPSHLLAALMEFCPLGEENMVFFRADFISGTTQWLGERGPEEAGCQGVQALGQLP